VIVWLHWSALNSVDCLVGGCFLLLCIVGVSDELRNRSEEDGIGCRVGLRFWMNFF
jgi:hypothetical protein